MQDCFASLKIARKSRESDVDTHKVTVPRLASVTGTEVVAPAVLVAARNCCLPSTPKNKFPMLFRYVFSELLETIFEQFKAFH